jgi:hypothetical protein
MRPTSAQIAVPVGGLLLVGAGIWAWRRRKGTSLLTEGQPVAPYPKADAAGPLGEQVRRAQDAGWDVLFATSEYAHGLPLGLLWAVASRETMMKDIVGDFGHGRGLMQIDDRSHGKWLRDHGVPGLVVAVSPDEAAKKGIEVNPGDLGKPPVADAIEYAGKLLDGARAEGRARGVKEEDLVKFMLSAYNAGAGGAASGYKQGDSDLRTTGKNYGADVLKRWRQMFPAGEAPPQIAGVLPMIGATREAGIAPALDALLDQVDAIWPKRNTASDGAIGDSDEPDHASGNAIDITNDPTHGPDLRALAEILLGDPRVHYVVFDSRIANRDVQAGAWRPYPEREEGEDVDEYEERAKGYNKHSRHIHISIRRSGRADGSRWPKGAKDNAALAAAVRAAPLAAPASIERLPELLRRGILQLWNDGLVDNFRWVKVQIGDYEIEVTADAAAVYGLRIPASFDAVLSMAGSVRDIIPPTKAIVDARWEHAAKRIVLDPIPGGAHKADGKDPIGVQQVQDWDARLGPLSPGPLYDGGWKEWILEPGIPEGKAVNYGLRREDGSVWQPPGHAHDGKWSDYSQLATFVKRKAKRNGVEVDLLDELPKGSPLGGPLPQWIVDRLNGGVA